MLAEKLNRDVDKVTEMSYVSFMWWTNFFILEAQEEYRRGNR